MSEYFTTDELADFLRIKPRKVYDLVSTDKVPYSRVMGKLLFSKTEISNWISDGKNNDLDTIVRACLPQEFWMRSTWAN